MGSIRIGGIIERYNEAFGITAQKVAPRLVQLANLAGANINLPGLKLYDEPTSELMKFANVTYQNSLTNKSYGFGLNASDNKALPFFKFQNKEQSNSFLAPPPMVSFRRGKNVVRTAIDRSEFEVIENFGLKPYEIRIQGILVDTNQHQYPQNLLTEIAEMFEADGTYAVTGTIFNDLGITELFFNDDFQVSFVEGFVDTVKYSVNAISTSDAEFLAQQQ